MRVLIACEFSGRVRDAFTALGHDAWSCDLLPSESAGGQHIVGDVLAILNDGWDLMIAHPPCTYLAKSGVNWLYNGGRKSGGVNVERWQAMQQAGEFFNILLSAPIPKIAIENPIMHSYGQQLLTWRFSQIIHPWMFGEGETKATCLWLRGLPPLMATVVSTGRVQRVNNEPDSKNRWKNRSRTYQGIANAMATQWAVS